MWIFVVTAQRSSRECSFPDGELDTIRPTLGSRELLLFFLLIYFPNSL